MRADDRADGLAESSRCAPTALPKTADARRRPSGRLCREQPMRADDERTALPKAADARRRLCRKQPMRADDERTALPKAANAR